MRHLVVRGLWQRVAQALRRGIGGSFTQRDAVLRTVESRGQLMAQVLAEDVEGAPPCPTDGDLAFVQRRLFDKDVVADEAAVRTQHRDAVGAQHAVQERDHRLQRGRLFLAWIALVGLDAPHDIDRGLEHHAVVEQVAVRSVFGDDHGQAAVGRLHRVEEGVAEKALGRQPKGLVDVGGHGLDDVFEHARRVRHVGARAGQVDEPPVTRAGAQLDDVFGHARDAQQLDRGVLDGAQQLDRRRGEDEAVGAEQAVGEAPRLIELEVDGPATAAQGGALLEGPAHRLPRTISIAHTHRIAAAQRLQHGRDVLADKDLRKERGALFAVARQRDDEFA